MISLSQYPSYFNNADPSKQVAVMRQYIITLKDEIESILSDIRYENLDPSLRAKFDGIDSSLTQLQKAIVSTDENINTNYTREADLQSIDARVQDLEDDHVTVQDLTDVSDRVTTIENADYQGQIDGLDERLDTIEGADYQGQIDDLDGRIDDLEAIDAGTRLQTLENADYQGQIDNLDGRVDDLEDIDADTRLQTLETDALTAANFNTQMSAVDAEVGTMKATSFKIGNDTFTTQTLTIDGTTFTFLGV